MGVAIVTGSSGLIGSQSVDFFINKGFIVIGIDNDMRSYFFGEDSSTRPTETKLKEKYGNKFINYDVDIRDYDILKKIFEDYKDNIDIVIHTAAQPSHDWASKEPLTDFTVNANGTLNLLELTRINAPKATFIFTSTNKVYGDRPNYIGLQEEELRYEFYENNELSNGVDEKMSIDNTKHSVFGASKVAADVMCQEYGKYFNMNVGVFRGGCLTGPNHASAELHGFLSYLIKCIINDKPYTIFGYKGKQVRDNIHSWDLVNMFWNFHQNPKQGEVYNVGGGRENSTSILEAINKTNGILGTKWDKYTISEENRVGDHMWYITNYDKFKKDYPKWGITISLDDTIKEIISNV